MLSEKVCIVAGGGRGIGSATAIELARQDATVVVNDLGTSLDGKGTDESPAKETVRQVRDAGGTGMAHYGDLTSFEYTEQLVADVLEEYGRLDGVVNCAGMLRDSIIYKMDPADWDAVIEVHLRSHFNLLRSASSHWREKAREHDDELPTQRSFLGTTSRAALGNVGQANYSAAKAGVLGLVRSASKELARYNIRVNALMPTAYTRMIENIPEEYQQIDEEEMPPEKVAPMVAYLLSDEASAINGSTIRAAGDAIGIVSDPEVVRLGYATDGWTAEGIADRFESEIAAGIDVDRTEDAF